MSWEQIAILLVRLLAQSGPEWAELRREVEAAVAEGRPLDGTYVESLRASTNAAYGALQDAVARRG